MAYAASKGIDDVDSEAEKFIDWHLAHGQMRADYDAACATGVAGRRFSGSLQNRRMPRLDQMAQIRSPGSSPPMICATSTGRPPRLPRCHSRALDHPSTTHGRRRWMALRRRRPAPFDPKSGERCNDSGRSPGLTRRRRHPA
jgi:hypothetical protein